MPNTVGCGHFKERYISYSNSIAFGLKSERSGICPAVE
jgi:hypothetical protein